MTPTPGDSGRLRTTPTTPNDSERLRTTPDDSDSGRLRTTLNDSERLWKTPDDSERLRTTADDSGRLRTALDDSKPLRILQRGPTFRSRFRIYRSRIGVNSGFLATLPITIVVHLSSEKSSHRCIQCTP
uniref:Uncharacterized protein n=1 Tax=Anopheles gambiae TaxID=7165 RepID=A0A0E4G9M6_ANOGA